MNEHASLADITFTENGDVDVAQLNALYRLIGWDRQNRRTAADTAAMLSVPEQPGRQSMLPRSMGGDNPVGGLPCQSLAEHWHAGDGEQRPLVPRSRSSPRLMPGVGPLL